MYDVIIIGRGPAGISASLYTSRANLSTLVISKGWGNLEKAGKIHNYYGADNDMSGIEILNSGVSQAKSFGVKFADDEAVGLTAGEIIEITGLKGKYKTKTLILAMGSPKHKPSFKNLEKFEGNGISYCGACDGFFYRDRKIAVIGYNDFMVHEVTELADITKNITILTNGMKVDISKEHRREIKQFSIVEDEIIGFSGKDVLEGVDFKNGTNQVFDGIFIAYGSASCAELAMKAGLITENGAMAVNREMETNLPGIYAAGDCTGGFRQVSVAVGEGAAAARSAIQFIRKSTP